jgi:hypothetical protein
VQELAGRHGADAWRLALVAGADPAAATRAALHALVIAAVQGGEAAGRAAILALARSWALSSPGRRAARHGEEPVVAAFWSLPEPLRAALWCTDGLGLDVAAVHRIVGSPPRAPAVARGRLRHRASTPLRIDGQPTSCRSADLAGLLGSEPPTTVTEAAAGHAASCDECSRLLARLRDPMAAVEAALPPAPDLVVLAGQAWRDHVGAPRRRAPEPLRRAAAAAGTRSRPLVAVLAVVTAGSFGAATSQLAAATTRPELPAALAVGPLPATTTRPRAPAVPPQAVIAPLAPEVALDPGLARLVTPDLALAAPAPAPPVPAPTPRAPSAPAVISEPPPAAERARRPPAVPHLQGATDSRCPSVAIGPLRLALPCER